MSYASYSPHTPPLALPHLLNESVEDEIFFGAGLETEDERKARTLCEEFEHAMHMASVAENNDDGDAEEEKEEQADMAGDADTDEEQEQPQERAPTQQTHLQPMLAEEPEDDGGNDDTTEHIPTSTKQQLLQSQLLTAAPVEEAIAMPYYTAELPSLNELILNHHTPQRSYTAPPAAALSPFSPQPQPQPQLLAAAPIATVTAAVVHQPTLLLAPHQTPASSSLLLSRPSSVPSSAASRLLRPQQHPPQPQSQLPPQQPPQQLWSDAVPTEIASIASSTAPFVSESELTSEITASIAAAAEVAMDDVETDSSSAAAAAGAGSVLTQIRTRMLKLKQGRSVLGGVGISKVPKLQPSGIPLLNRASTTPSATTSRIPVTAASKPLLAAPSSTPVAQSTPLFAASATTSFLRSQQPAIIAAAPILTSSAPTPVTSQSLQTQQQPPAVIRSASVAPASSPSYSSTPASSFVAPIPAPSSFATRLATTAHPNGGGVGARSLSTLASSKQLASPAPAKKTMSMTGSSINNRTASIQAQVAALQSQQQKQQLQQKQPALTSLAARTSALASSSAAASARPLPPAAPSSSAAAQQQQQQQQHPSRRRGVVWRDEDSSLVHVHMGALEDVRFMSPAVTPEKDYSDGGSGGSGGGRDQDGFGSPQRSMTEPLSLSLSYLQFAQRYKPMPDLTKTPTKSCLRRSSASTPAPITAVGVNVHVGGQHAASAAVVIAAATAAADPTAPATILTAAPQRVLSNSNVNINSNVAGTYSGVQSGARRVPNLTKPSAGGSVGSLGAGGALRTLNVQPQAAAPADKSSTGLLKKPLGLGAGLGALSNITNSAAATIR